MIREGIVRACAQRPRTLEELSHDLGIPEPLLRSALAVEFYRQSEINHPEHGPMTVWSVGFSRLRVDAQGRYYVAAEAS